MPPGNHSGRRGHPLRLNRRRHLSERAAAQLRLIAWAHYKRPTTEEEEQAVLEELIDAAAQALTPPAPEQTPEEIAAFWRRVEESNAREDEAE
jgi:hypothetical protein